MQATLWFDGSSQPHTVDGVAGWSYVLEGDQIGRLEGADRVHKGLRQSVNIAEYSGLIEGLSRAYMEGVTDLHIIGDSQLIIYQMTGKYKVKDSSLKLLNAEAKSWIPKFDRVVFDWQRRAHNKADALSRPKEK